MFSFETFHRFSPGSPVLGKVHLTSNLVIYEQIRMVLGENQFTLPFFQTETFSVASIVLLQRSLP